MKSRTVVTKPTSATLSEDTQPAAEIASSGSATPEPRSSSLSNAQIPRLFPKGKPRKNPSFRHGE